MEEGSLYYASPIWLIFAAISFFLSEDWGERPVTTAVLSLLFGPILLFIVIIAKISSIKSSPKRQESSKKKPYKDGDSKRENLDGDEDDIYNDNNYYPKNELPF